MTQKNKSGFSLIEAMVSLLILSIVSIGVLSIFPAIRSQQKDEDVKNIGRKVILDSINFYRQLNYAPLLLQKDGSALVWVACFDASGNPLGVSGTNISDPQFYKINENAPGTIIGGIPPACKPDPKTVELHVWAEPNTSPQKFNFLSLVRLGNNTVINFTGASYFSNN